MLFRSFEASFDIRTNIKERRYCIEQTCIEPSAKRPLPEYFEQLASAYFCISPHGNGVDCYRTWQALYLRTIPVVTRSVLTEQHPDLPMIVLDDWSEFRSIDFSPELYARTWSDWDPGEVGLNHYVERVRATLGRLQDATGSRSDSSVAESRRRLLTPALEPDGSVALPAAPEAQALRMSEPPSR